MEQDIEAKLRSAAEAGDAKIEDSVKSVAVAE